MSNHILLVPVSAQSPKAQIIPGKLVTIPNSTGNTPLVVEVQLSKELLSQQPASRSYDAMTNSVAMTLVVTALIVAIKRK